jgi:hypothetical protein
MWARQDKCRAVMIANVPAEIHTNYLPDNSLRHYCYTYLINNLPLSKSYSQIYIVGVIMYIQKILNFTKVAHTFLEP